MTTKRSGPPITATRPNAEDPTKDPHGVLRIDEPTPEIRPRCRVVGAYCEALHWLQREPYGPAAVCCRHYWGDIEAAS